MNNSHVYSGKNGQGKSSPSLNLPAPSQETDKARRLGYRLKKARDRVKWTQDQAASFFGLGSKVAISLFESGNRPLTETLTHKKIIDWIRTVERLRKQEAIEKYPRPGKKYNSQTGDYGPGSVNFSPEKTGMIITQVPDGVNQNPDNFLPEKTGENKGSETSEDNSQDNGQDGPRFPPLPDVVRAKVKGIESCLLCGNTRQPNSKYWADLPELIVNRALVLLKAGSRDTDNADFAKGYGYGVLEMLAAIMSRNRKQLLYILEREGFVDAFLARPTFHERQAQYSVLFPVRPVHIERKQEADLK